MKKVLSLLSVFTLLISAEFAIAQTCEEAAAAQFDAYISQCNIYGPCSPTGGANVDLTISTENTNGTPSIKIACKQYACSNNAFLGAFEYGVALCDSNFNSIASTFSSIVSRSSNKCGSVVQVENQAIGETVPLTGIGFTMNYFSHWAQGRSGDYKISVPIAGNPVRDDITSFDVQVLDGVTVVQSTSYVNTTPNVTFSYTWNGLDASSNPTLGTKTFDVVVTEHHTSIATPIPIKTRLAVGSFKAKLLGLGGWIPSVYNFYDVNSKKLFRGDGSIRFVEAKVWNTSQYLIAAEDGSEVYIFDSNGKQLYTKTSLLGTNIYTFNYDGQGRLISISEPFSRTTTFDRNISGDFVSITSPKGQVTSITLDGNGYVSAITNPNSESYSTTYYGSQGLIHTFTKPEGQVSTFTYDANGQLTQDAHSGGYFFDLVKNFSTTNLDYSHITRMGRQSNFQGTSSNTTINRTTTLPSGIVNTYSYGESLGSASETINSNGQYISNSFTSDARFGDQARFLSTFYTYYGGAAYSINSSQSVTLTDPDDPFSVTAYSVTALKGSSSVTTGFDPSTKVFTITTGLGRTSESEIDSYERPVSIQRGSLYPVELTYTNQNLTKIKQNSRETNLAYNSTTGFLSTLTNPLSQVTGFAYDSAGRVIAKTLPDLRVVGYSYDGNGNVAGVTPPNRPIHVFGMNSSEEISSYEPPTLSGVTTVNTTYSYDNDKQLTQILKPTGSSIDFTYNSTTGVLEKITTPAGDYTYVMNSVNGLPYSIVSPSSGPVTYISYMGTMPYQYTTYTGGYSQISDYSKYLSSNGTVGTDIVTSPTGSSSISYAYDDDELLTTAGDLTLTNDTPNGMLTDTSIGTSPNIVTDAYTYNSFGEVTGYQAKYGTTVIYDLTLGRDGMGRINSKTQTMNSTTNAYAYTFDTTGRLTQVDKNSTTVATYGYDDNSNRNSGTIGAQPTTATYDAQDRMTAYNLLSFTYNANGDLTSKTNTLTSTTTSYVYDVFGNLTSVTLPSTDVITYEIDGLNRRIGKSINGTLQARWVYMDQTRIAAELDGSGNITKRFVYASKGNIPDYMIIGGDNYRIISDQLGSPRLVVKVSDGSIAERMDHDEFGRVITDTNPGLLPFGFAGGLYDVDTGLVRFGARDYDSETGRWTSKDPILFNGGDTNLFGYVLQDPINLIDSLGRAPNKDVPPDMNPNQCNDFSTNPTCVPPICGLFPDSCCVLAGKIAYCQATKDKRDPDLPMLPKPPKVRLPPGIMSPGVNPFAPLPKAPPASGNSGSCEQ